ncbi:unnamed protein product [Mytilus coruscus]|uniref:MEGF10_11 n=1 Tax=Mytilus coruscus TaxID=42192 RepID=A0A6J8E510_MYTCO|nr:unnamed protein product [Mytilus coruscus]
MDHQKSLLMVLIFKYLSFARSTGVCSRIHRAESNNFVFYYQKKSCCDNYEQIGTAGCLECRIGFTSKAGSKCIPCPKNTYGLRCASHCNCKQERCHHIHGCVENVTEQNFITLDINASGELKQSKKKGYSISNISSTLTANLYQTTPTEVLNKETGLKTETASVLITIRAIETIDNTPDATEDAEPLLSNTAIYFTLGGTVIFIIGLVLSLSYVFWKKILARSIRLQDLSSSIAQVPQVPIEMPESQSESSMEHEYEEIDEENLISERMVSDHETISISSSTNKSVYGGTDIDGYLHSYHSLVIGNNLSKDNDAESTSEDINISEYKQYQQISESFQEQDECSCTKHQSNRNKGMPVQDIHVMSNEYLKYM